MEPENLYFEFYTIFDELMDESMQVFVWNSIWEPTWESVRGSMLTAVEDTLKNHEITD